MKNPIFKKTGAWLAIIILLMAPVLLVIDYNRFVPVVALVWMIALIYFLFVKPKKS